MPNGKKRPFLYTRPQSPHWWYCFVINGRKYRGSTARTDAAEAALVVEEKRVEARAAIQEARNSVGHIGDGSRQLTISQCLERFREAKEDGWRNAKCRQVNAEYCLDIGKGPDMLISEIRLSDLAEFRRRRKKMVNRKGEPIKDSTVNRDLAHLRAAIRYAAKSGFEVPQLDWSEAIKNKAEKHRTRTLSAAEETRLFQAIADKHPDLMPIVRFAILTAARKSAVLGLRWDAVDFDSKLATIELKGEGDSPLLHAIPLTDGLVELLKAQPLVQDCPFVFTYECRRGDKRANLVKGRRYPWTEHGIYKPWNAVVASAGLRDFRFHDLRHTGATRLVRATNNLELARQLLGHADIKTTQKYANLNTDDVRNGLERLEAMTLIAKA